MMLIFKLAWIQVWSMWRAGALRVLVFSLVLAVAAITAVSFFTQRVDSALNQQGGLLLGGDLSIQADHVIRDMFAERAEAQGITTVNTYEFASMVMHGELSQLAQIKAVAVGFPLRGDLTIGATIDGAGRIVKAVPKAGETWVEPRLAHLLNVQVGDSLSLGETTLRVGAILLREPSRGGDMFSFAPRLMMNAADLPATKLIQYGSRVTYQLLLASTPEKIRAYYLQVKPEIARGEKIEDVRNARPEIKLALDKAQQFLGLSAMVSVILAMVAMLLSSLPYIKQSLDTFALMRTFGTQQSTLLQVLVVQTFLIALLSALLGVLLGFFVQLGLAELAGSLFLENLPPGSVMPVLLGVATGVAMMIAVVFPHVWQMRRLTTVNILRRETLLQPISNQAKFLPAALIMVVMIFLQAQDAKIALATILAILGLCLLVLVFAYSLISLTRSLFTISPSNKIFSSLCLGVQGLRTRLALSTVQMIGFSMGLMVLILLALIRSDLVHNWQVSLPENAPNRFVINIQPSQMNGINTFFTQHKIEESTIFPMVRGRLMRKNGHLINAAQWKEERAKRLAEREFNLSWAAEMQSDNRLEAGRWWTPQEHGKPYLSLEQDLAKTLGIQLGDRLVFDIAGQPLTLTVTNLRKVDWDTMRVNFFAITPPSVLEQYPANYISSFHLPVGAYSDLNQLVKQYPNLTVIDVATLMQQVRGIMQRMSSAIEYVFTFSLIAGLAVLYAALVATREERIVEATLMRVFGASRRQVGVAYIAEFACIGLIAAFVATATANALAYYLSVNILNIPFQFNFGMAMMTMLAATTAIPLAAWISLRQFLNVPPRQLLNSI